MNKAVLDASALIAYVNGEPGAQVVTQILNDALISSVNFAEVVSKLVNQGQPSQIAEVTARRLTIQVVDFDKNLAIRAGTLREQTRSAGLSLGDRACLALAERENLPALTTDRIWSTLNLQIQVQLIR